MPGIQNKRLGLLSQNESSGTSDSRSNSSGDSFKNSSTDADSRRTKNKTTNSRIISSRYRQAAVAASQKNASYSPKDSSRIPSPLDRTQAKITHSAANRPSSVTTSKLSYKQDPLKQKSKKNTGSKDVEATDKATLRLHSTAVNSSTFFEKTNLSSPEYFSTTIVAQKGVRHNHPCSGDSIATLSDISEIVPSSMQEDKKIESSFGFNFEMVNVHDEARKNYTNDDLEKEYLEYLTWAFINKRSEEAFEKQIKEAKNQVSFLTLLNEVQDEEISEEKQKIELLDCFENISLKHEKLKEKLLSFNETVEPCEKAFDDLCHHLELQMNQIKLENIYIPTDEESSYKECLDSALQEGVSNLQEFSSNVTNSRNLLHSVSNLFENVIEESNQLESCLKQREKLANVAIQESSLKLYRSSSKSV
ncbi:UNVERIFIED_CONTAM: hypothetical protein RMT77_007906 [Armadillidium vulgare]